jgi:hypothetical protein
MSITRLAAATALSAAGFLMASAPAQAYPTVPLAPACLQYGFPGDVQIRQNNGWNVTFSSTGTTASGPATAKGASGATMQGTVSGSINQRHVDLAFPWDSGQTGHYVGDVGDDGKAHGTTGSASWDTVFPLSCITQPDAPPPQQPAGPQKTMATVVGENVDVYNIAAGDVPDPDDPNAPVGVKIGELQVGRQVELAGACNPQDWCKVLVPELTGGVGFVWGHLQF